MKKFISFGEVMMRLSPPATQRFTQATSFDMVFGGSEANVAVGLASFGIRTSHVTRFPESDLGKRATAELRRYGVDVEHIVYGSDRLGIYFIEHGASVRAPHVIYDRGDSAFANLKPSMFNWNEILKGASWFHWSGITPAISQAAATACHEAIQTARRLGIKVSGDINYRRNLWQYGKGPLDIMPGLIEACDVVVGGLTDFENCLGISSNEFSDAAQIVSKKFPAIKKITTTYRETLDASHNKVSAVLWDGHSLLKSKHYDLFPIVDRIGTGDAFMAGLAYGWLSGMKDQEVLDFATATFALKHAQPGDVSTTSVTEVAELLRGENVGKLLR